MVHFLCPAYHLGLSLFGIEGSLLLAVIATSIYSCIYFNAGQIEEINDCLIQNSEKVMGLQ